MDNFTPFLDWYGERYRRQKGRLPSASTLRSKRSHLRLAADALSLNHDAKTLSFALADRDEVDVLLDTLMATKSPVYVRCIGFTLLHLGEYAKLTFSTSTAIRMRDLPNPEYQPHVDIYERPDIERLLDGARIHSYRFYLFVLTLLETGRRLNEVLGIRYEDLRTNSEVPHFRLYKTKGGKDEVVPLSPALIAAFSSEGLEKLRSDPQARPTTKSADEYLFVWSDHSARHAFKKICERLNIDYKRVHGTRHTFATNMLAKGVPLHAVSKLLGHSNTIVTQMVYDHTTTLDMARYLDPTWTAGSNR